MDLCLYWLMQEVDAAYPVPRWRPRWRIVPMDSSVGGGIYVYISMTFTGRRSWNQVAWNALLVWIHVLGVRTNQRSGGEFETNAEGRETWEMEDSAGHVNHVRSSVERQVLMRVFFWVLLNTRTVRFRQVFMSDFGSVYVLRLWRTRLVFTSLHRREDG